ncbi:MAG: GTP-binding protein [Bacteroidetes bacterium]|nr:MAG: GTP-binding protein [Bacteroidota bacterium]
MSNYLDMDLLRFTTAGSVDDGKSTLIGRLLYDTKSIFEDQMQAIEDASTRKGKEYVDLSLLTDGLRDERAQGITIDVAYRYFATPKRKFIIADTPGHIQYTRNMVTGASTANLAIILIDARKGVIEQTYRHSIIASLLDIKHVVVAINKMDLVDFDQAIFEKIKADYLLFSNKLNIKDIHFIPMSALLGDNVVDESENMKWFSGKTLLQTLESVDLKQDINIKDFRFAVQYVIRPHSTDFHDYRGYAGRIESGKIKVGDTITAMQSGIASKVKSINFGTKEILEAEAGMSVSITLETEIDISRGDMLVKTESLPQSSQEIEMMLCWMNDKKAQTNGKYIIRHTGKEAKCVIKNIDYKLNISTLEKIEEQMLGVNDIGKIKVKTSSPLFFDSYMNNHATGSVILVDEFTNETVGAGMIL